MSETSPEQVVADLEAEAQTINTSDPNAVAAFCRKLERALDLLGCENPPPPPPDPFPSEPTLCQRLAKLWYTHGCGSTT